MSDTADNSPASKSSLQSAAIAALLDFYVEAGVDFALDDAPVDRFRESAQARAASPLARQSAAPPAPQPAAAVTAPNRSAGHEGADDTVRAARELARNADTLDALRAALAGFEGCALKRTAKNLVFSDGTPHARVMLVGEAPGRDEDLQGKPFVGRSGRLLDRMLAAIGLDRAKNAYIANIVPWRPPGNRTPTPQEAAACHPFIQRQIELADPDILVCLGGPSVQALLGVKEGILRTRGRWFTYNTGKRDIRALATLHPAYLLRQPLQKRLAWRDFKALRKALAE
ncbi:uracil-DNA glycosylase [Pseudochelatococcus sp. B33]